MPMWLEKKIVEDDVIERLKAIGWNYLEPEKLVRLSFEEPLLLENLRRKIRDINEKIELEEEDLKNVISQLQRVFPDQNGAREILRYFKYGVPIKTAKERSTRYLQLFDFENLENNEFLFTNQFSFRGRENIRLDLLLFVNGIPLINIECKNPYSEKTDYFSAFSQIKRYEKKAPELYKYIQIGIGFAEVVKYFPIVNWLEDVNQYVWKKEGEPEESAIFELLKPAVFLDILKNFIFVREFRGEMTKVIARYMQYRAANKIYQRVIENLAGKTNKNKGLIWHWLGAGKTLTMIFSAYKIFNRLGKPTIFFIVDRKDLERQFNEEFSSLDLGAGFRNYEKVESIEELKEIISFDDFRGKRGVFLTLIHKFNLDEIYILEKIRGKSEISKRKDIICFLDEVHRTQYGILHDKMSTILKNAFFFGFTGTPIALKDRNTYKRFGYPIEEELYLDRYFIDQAIGDGFVVPIVYEVKKEKDINLKDEDLEWWLKQIDIDEIGEEIDLGVLQAETTKKINEITLFLENPKNIEVVCQDIVQHFKENFDGKFKGLIVTGSRKACVRFKRILDKYLPSEYSEVVMTYNQGDTEEIESYKRKLIEEYKTSDINEILKRIIEKFQKEEYPKLLIVTDMLITGFDEPKLGVIYLYKILKSYRLLQTTARVNRPLLERGKAAGWIIDYVGIFKEFERAIKFYLKDDIKVIKRGVFNSKTAINKFEELIKEMEGIFGNLLGEFEREKLDLAFKIITQEEEKGEKFIALFQELRAWFEILPKAEKRLEYLEKYKWLSGLYYKFIKTQKIGLGVDEVKKEKFFKKTIATVHELMKVSGIENVIPATAIDLEYIEKIRESKMSDTEKTIGILGALQYAVVTLGPKNPVYKSIAEKVRALIKRWRERTIEISDVKDQIEELLKYIKEKEREKRESGLNQIEFGIKLSLENKILTSKEEIENLAKEIYSQIKSYLYPEWNRNPAIVKEVSRTIREFLAKIRVKYQLLYEVFAQLHQDIFDYIYNNA